MMELTAGKLSLWYEKGYIRYMRLGSLELVRMIYLAVRDVYWGTVPLAITAETFHLSEHGFTILFQASTIKDDIHMEWQVAIDGGADSHLSFAIRGVALHQFSMNRIGLCVLHPLEECRGLHCEITHPDGTTEDASFPKNINPDLVFRDIREMRWQPAPGWFAHLAFSGDVFETEDQRNWTDHSYKTYGTPLALPFPVVVDKGFSVQQSVVFDIMPDGLLSLPLIPSAKWYPPNPSQAPVVPIVFHPETTAFPLVGVGRPSRRENGYVKVLPHLSHLGLSHYRVELHLYDASWRIHIQEVNAEALALGVPIELVLLFSNEYARELDALLPFLREFPIKQLLVLQIHQPAPSQELLDHCVERLGTALPAVPLGSGTNANFAELNRSTIAADRLDFLSFSLHPQVHASDDLTLIENLPAQGEAVASARGRYPGKAVHVSPVTLDARHQQDLAAGNGDPRQKTRLLAGWTIGSFKYLAEQGVASITYFETAGDRGIIGYDEKRQTLPYPVLSVFEHLLTKGWDKVQRSSSPYPLLCSSLVLLNQHHKTLLVANHQAFPITVVVDSNRYALQPFEFVVFEAPGPNVSLQRIANSS